MHKSEYVYKMGIEIEGAIDKVTYNLLRNGGLTNHGSFHYDGSVNIQPKSKLSPNGLISEQITWVGEAVSPPLPCNQLQAWVMHHHPIEQNSSCGTHIHVSLTKQHYYDRLATKEFYYWFLSQTYNWFSSLPTYPTTSNVAKAFTDRLLGKNQYCCPNYQPCRHSHGRYDSDDDTDYGCNHECNRDNGCINCNHDCEDSEQMQFALEGDRSGCLIHTCNHEHDNDCGEAAEYYDECWHVCETMECFMSSRHGCRHSHNSRCSEIDCIHECDYDCGGIRQPILNSPRNEGIHVPQRQRRASQKNSERYAHINYCEAFHNTIEFRLFPAFCNSTITADCVKFVQDAIEQYLSMPDPNPLAVIQRPPQLAESGVYNGLADTVTIFDLELKVDNSLPQGQLVLTHTEPARYVSLAQEIARDYALLRDENNLEIDRQSRARTEHEAQMAMLENERCIRGYQQGLVQSPPAELPLDPQPEYSAIAIPHRTETLEQQIRREAQEDEDRQRANRWQRRRLRPRNYEQQPLQPQEQTT